MVGLCQVISSCKALLREADASTGRPRHATAGCWPGDRSGGSCSAKPAAAGASCASSRPARVAAAGAEVASPAPPNILRRRSSVIFCCSTAAAVSSVAGSLPYLGGWEEGQQMGVQQAVKKLRSQLGPPGALPGPQSGGCLVSRWSAARRARWAAAWAGALIWRVAARFPPFLAISRSLETPPPLAPPSNPPCPMATVASPSMARATSSPRVFNVSSKTAGKVRGGAAGGEPLGAGRRPRPCARPTFTWRPRSLPAAGSVHPQPLLQHMAVTRHSQVTIL